MSGVLRWDADETLVSRFLRLAAPTSLTGCWNWRATITVKGYGRMKIRGRQYAAHRVSYQLARGPIPDGLHIDHRCKQRSCVNPQHLEPVTILENNRRSDCVSTVNAAKQFCPAGHPYAGGNLYVTNAGSRQCRTCNKLRARQYRARYVGGAQ